MPSPPTVSPLNLTLTVLAGRFALCRFAADDPIPEWTKSAREFLTISRTPAELSIVADEAVVPPSVKAHRGYRAFRVEGPLALDLVGIAASIAGALASAKVPIIPIGTYDTDYVLVHQDMLATAVSALEQAGHKIVLESA
jgi:hypothetical protein